MYALMLEVDEGENCFVGGDGNSWGPSDPVKLYKTYEEALIASEKWNDARVIDWNAYNGLFL